jgi:hypothetical protein
MNKQILRPEELRVDSFTTAAPADEARTAAEVLARTRVGGACFPSSDRTCTC